MVTGKERGFPVHELAIRQSVVDAVLQGTGEQPVSLVQLAVGRLTGVVPDARTGPGRTAASDLTGGGR
jgi:hypothetical protein